MKIWLKLLIGSILGVCLGFLFPGNNQAFMDNLAWFGDLAIRLGRYVLVPMVVFSLTIAVYELRQDGHLWGLIFRTFLVMIFCSAFVIVAGIIVVLLFPPSRIPILNIEHAEAVSLDIAGRIMELFPSNMFTAMFNDGVYLLPLCVFALFLGIGLSYDWNYTKPIISLFDSLSRIFYYISTIFSEVLGLILIVLSAYWAIRFGNVVRAEIYRDLILLLAVFSIILGCGILPLFIYFLRPKTNPWLVLYGSISQGLAAFFSGDINFTLPILYRQMKENLGVRRRANSITVTLFAFFGRAGSAMVAAVSLIVIINSYSSLSISTSSIITIAFRALLISFLLAGYPGTGAYTALAVLCLEYGQGFEAGYLILRPLAFYLIAIGTFLDVMICSVASYGIGRFSGFQENRELKRFL